jgi:hypothetical protein
LEELRPDPAGIFPHSFHEIKENFVVGICGAKTDTDKTLLNESTG